MTTTTRNDMAYCTIRPHTLPFRSKLESGRKKDLYFLGATKNRFTEIIEAYESCTQNGLKCDFNLVGVPGKQQVYKDDIHYIKSMPYRENLSRASRSKCLLEILQKNAKGYTPRMWEAILLGKKIMTNNPTVRYSPFYDERYVSIFTDTKTRYGFHPGQSRSQNRLSLYRSAIAPTSARIHNRPLKRNCMII